MYAACLLYTSQEYNAYAGGGNEEDVMNQIADAMEPYLRSSGIRFVRNDPDQSVGAAIRQSNAGSFDLHLALHSNAAPPDLSGQLREMCIRDRSSSSSLSVVSCTVSTD